MSRLIGAPPGYVGYDEGGQLTEQVRRKPYSVILFDEVEKAHPDVFNALLQVLDEGRLTDGQGRTVDFKNTVLVMTSNLGSQMIQGMAGSDYQVVKLAVMAEVKMHFRPEFVNRIDEVVVFHALAEENIKSIARIQLRILQQRLAKMDYGLEVSDAALAELAKVGLRPGLRRAAAEARHPVRDREPAGEGDPRRPLRAKGHDRGRLARRQDGVREKGDCPAGSRRTSGSAGSLPVRRPGFSGSTAASSSHRPSVSLRNTISTLASSTDHNPRSISLLSSPGRQPT